MCEGEESLRCISRIVLPVHRITNWTCVMDSSWISIPRWRTMLGQSVRHMWWTFPTKEPCLLREPAWERSVNFSLSSWWYRLPSVWNLVFSVLTVFARVINRAFRSSNAVLSFPEAFPSFSVASLCWLFRFRTWFLASSSFIFAVLIRSVSSRILISDAVRFSDVLSICALKYEYIESQISFHRLYVCRVIFALFHTSLEGVPFSMSFVAWRTLATISVWASIGVGPD